MFSHKLGLKWKKKFLFSSVKKRQLNKPIISDFSDGNVSNFAIRIGSSSILSRIILIIIELLSLFSSISFVVVVIKSILNKIRLAVHDEIWFIASIKWQQPSGKNNYALKKKENF